jgi:NAD+ synthetase
MGNIKARMRMIYLYNLASKTGGLVLGTENLTEYLLGFFTLAGDDASDFELIKDLWKTEVYEMTDWLINNELFFNSNKQKALQSCIDATATDGLGITNSDLDQILPGFIGSSRDGYKKVDDILINYLDNNIFDENNPVIIRKIKSEFKRNHPVTISHLIYMNHMQCKK